MQTVATIEDFKQDLEELDDADVAVASYVAGTDEEKRLVRKVDKRLLPMLWVMYIFNYIDRTNIGNARVAGMEADLALSSSDFALALSIFFVGYLLAEVPSNMILTRSRPSIFLAVIMAVWGILTITAVGITNTAGLIALRFFLGFVEAGFFPGVIYLLSCWYKPFELSKRLAIFYSASLIAGAFGGLLAGVITEYMNGAGGVRGWKWLFVIEGIATVVLAAIAVYVLPDYPATTKWLTSEEQALAVLRLSNVESQPSGQVGHMESLKLAVKDWKTWAFTLGYMSIVGAGTISYFFPTLMLTLGYSARNAQFMTVPIYCVALIVGQALGFSSDHFEEKAFHVIGGCTLSAISFIVCGVSTNGIVRYVFICFGGAGLWGALPIFLGYAIGNFEGKEKRAVQVAIVNALGNLASVYGSQIWPSFDAPQYKIGFAVSTALIGLGGLIVLALRLKLGDPAAAFKRRELEVNQSQEMKRDNVGIA